MRAKPARCSGFSVSARVMSSIETPPIISLANKLRRAIHNGTKLHLESGEVAMLLHDQIYNAISRLEAEELRNACARDADNDNTNWAASGCGSAPTQEPGASAGLNASELEAVSRGARLRLSEARSELLLRKKQVMR